MSMTKHGYFDSFPFVCLGSVGLLLQLLFTVITTTLCPTNNILIDLRGQGLVKKYEIDICFSCR
jgi:hypothetical protein